MANTALITSTDGINWTPQTSPFDVGVGNAAVQTITYGDGIFIAWGFNPSSGAPLLCTSPDGVTWTTQTIARTSNVGPMAIAYSSAFGFIIGGSDSASPQNVIEISSNGTSWVDHSFSQAGAAEVTGLAANSSIIVATVGTSGGSADPFAISNNGTVWTAEAASGINSGICVTYGGSDFVGLGVNDGTGAPGLYISTTGTSWASETLPSGFPTSFTGLSYAGRASYTNGNYFISFGPHIISSPNGTAWTNLTISNFTDTGGYGTTIGGVIYNGSDYVAIGNNGNIIQSASSPDGVTWSTVAQLITLPFVVSVASSGSLFVAGGYVSFYTPPAITSAVPTDSGVALIWTSALTSNYTLQYRVTGTSPWTTVSGLTSTIYTVAGLASNTEYDFQVEGTLIYADASGSTGYSSIVNATTLKSFTYGPIPIFPSLPEGWPVNVSPVLDTIIGTTKSLREMRVYQRTEPLWDIEILFEELLDQTQNQTPYEPFLGDVEYEQLCQLFLQMYGTANVFAFDCPWDDSRSNQLIGTGDGTTQLFTVYRTWGSGALATLAPVGVVNAVTNVKINGVTQASSAYFISRNKIYFYTTPGAGLPITMTFSFYYLCRFTEDEQDFEEFAKNRWNVKSLKMQSVTWP